uniref:Uncharacterized protein n=1 Tax=Lactuca sativa TaxID=4236 RepID=A0A9R1UJ97_LACSA|nr:hypothetical protein LSAT_V11C900458410 [Lactuca sativa]
MPGGVGSESLDIPLRFKSETSCAPSLMISPFQMSQIFRDLVFRLMAFFMFISLDISLIYAYLQINQPDGLDKLLLLFECLLRLNPHNQHSCPLLWCGFPFPTFNLVKEMIDFAAKWGRCPIKRTVLLSVIYCSLWILWKARNDMVFNKNYSSPAKTADCIITVTFKGVKFRSNFGASNWPDWACCPPNIL